MIWRSCERLGILPPGVNREWEDNIPWVQALIMAYQQVRETESDQEQANLLKALFGAR